MLQNSIVQNSGRLGLAGARRGAAFDVAVVGGGPGGYVAAIRAAQEGLSVACVEKRKTLGGTCLNVGCIPTKAMLASTHKLHEARHTFKNHGLLAGEQVRLDYSKMVGARDKTVTQLTKGIEFLFKKNKVTHIKAAASFASPTSLSLGSETVEAKHIIVATGSVPAPFPGGAIPVDNVDVLDSTGILGLKKTPESLVVIGGGAIGLEFGSVFARLGVRVDVIEFMPCLAPGMDSEVSKGLEKLLSKEGIHFHLGTKVLSCKKNSSGHLEIIADRAGKQITINADKVLVSVGRRAYTEGLRLDAIGLSTDRLGRLEVDDHFCTKVDSVRAIGDVIPGPMLAHKAEEDAVACVTSIVSGQGEKVDYNLMPGVIYTHPEAAAVGASEDVLKKEKREYIRRVFPLVANSRSKSSQETDGFVKVLVDETTDKILGASILAPQAGDLIQEFVLAMKFGIKATDLGETVHAHPTVCEAVKEAAMKKPIHL